MALRLYKLALCAATLSTIAASPLPRAVGDVDGHLLERRQVLATPSTTGGATGTTTASASAATTSSSNPYYNGFLSSERSPLLSIVTIVLACALLCLVIIARIIYVRRHYRLSARALFVPASGINFCGLFRVSPPKPLPPSGPPPAYYSTSASRGMPRPHRRGHRVDAADIGDGGVRAGRRDIDDAWDGEPETGPDGEEKEDELPRYAVDVDLPGYPPRARRRRTAENGVSEVERTEGGESAMAEGARTEDGVDPTLQGGVNSDALQRTRTTESGANVGDDAEEAYLSSQAYEAATRAHGTTAIEMTERGAGAPSTSAATTTTQHRGEVV